MNSLLRFFDVRPAESRPLLAAFGSLLFIVIAHTMLETARDTMFLVHVGPGALGYMYITTAALTLVAGSMSSRLIARLGARRALVVGQLVSAAGAVGFFFLPPTTPALSSLYAFSALSGALLVPQLWATVGSLFHPGQGRRLFGIVAIAGVLGAVLGSSIGAGALLVADVRWLLLASAAAFATSSAIIGLAPRARAAPVAQPKGPTESWVGAFRDEPALARVALVVALGATTALFVDYLFKAVAAADVPPERLGPFLARYYAATNIIALAVQVLLSRRILAHAGVVGTAGLMPSLMFFGSMFGFLTGGGPLAVFGTKGVDGALRHSVYRTGLELVYLAIPSAARDRARPIIDGAFTRLSQAAAAGLVLLLVYLGRSSPRQLAFVAACSAAAWLAAAVALRAPYVALFRRALLGPERAAPRSAEELDLASVELLVEALTSPRPREAIAAMDALSRRGRAGLVPGLMLLREEEDVLESALQLFGSSRRADWQRLAARLLSDPRERVRRAALRAIARARHAPGAHEHEHEGTLLGERPWIQGYLAVDALTYGTPEGSDHLALLTPDADGREARLGMLTALADSGHSPALAALLLSIVESAPEPHDRETAELVARAAASVRATEIAPRLLARLAVREGRMATASALVALGDTAFTLLAEALSRPETPRNLRGRLPLALAAFGTQRAANLLFAFVQRGDDGFVRYRCLRALEKMAANHAVRLAPRDVQALIRRELTEHFCLLALRHPLSTAPAGARTSTRDLALRLLDEKRAQALGRVFGLLKLCYPSENLREVQTALTSVDATRRVTAAEFLDELLAPHRRQRDDGVRALLRLGRHRYPTHRHRPDPRRPRRRARRRPRPRPHERPADRTRTARSRPPRHDAARRSPWPLKPTRHRPMRRLLVAARRPMRRLLAAARRPMRRLLAAARRPMPRLLAAARRPMRRPPEPAYRALKRRPPEAPRPRPRRRPLSRRLPGAARSGPRAANRSAQRPRPTYSASRASCSSPRSCARRTRSTTRASSTVSPTRSRRRPCGRATYCFARATTPSTYFS